MPEKQGFLNAPTVTEFAVGMVVLDSDGERLGIVVRADERGGLLTRDPDLVFVRTDSIPTLRLDLSSKRMWVGREYRAIGYPEVRAKVLAPPECTEQGRVHFVGHNAVFCCWSVADFLRVYEPVPKVEMSDDEKMEDVCRRVVRSLVREYLVDMNAQRDMNSRGLYFRRRDKRENEVNEQMKQTPKGTKRTGCDYKTHCQYPGCDRFVWKYSFYWCREHDEERVAKNIKDFRDMISRVL